MRTYDVAGALSAALAKAAPPGDGEDPCAWAVALAEAATGRGVVDVAYDAAANGVVVQLDGVEGFSAFEAPRP